MIAPLVLSFDLDDTLWPVGPVMLAAERQLLAWLRARHPHLMDTHDIDSMRALRAAVARRHPERAHDMTFLRHRALQNMFAGATGVATPGVATPGVATPGVATPAFDAARSELLADEALEVFFTERNRVTFYDDVEPALRRLRTRYKLYALSNGNADLARCGIAHLFDGHISAISAGAAKPDARIFHSLLAAAGVEAWQVLHIGDDPHADVVGATAAGLQAAWLNRDAREWPAQFAPPPRTISTLMEII